MDSLGRRAPLMHSLDKAIESARKPSGTPNRDNTGSFSRYLRSRRRAQNIDKLPEHPRLGRAHRLAAEKEILGFHHGHPLEKYKTSARLERSSTEDINAMQRSTAKDENITTAGLITGCASQRSKRGELWGKRTRRHVRKVELLIFRSHSENSERRPSWKFSSHPRGVRVKTAQMPSDRQ